MQHKTAFSSGRFGIAAATIAEAASASPRNRKPSLESYAASPTQQNATQKRLFRPRCKLGTAGCPAPQNLPENSRQPDDSKFLIRNWFRLLKKEYQSRKPVIHNLGKPLNPRPTSHLPEPPFYLRSSASICGLYGFPEPSNTRQPNPALQIRPNAPRKLPSTK